MEHVGQVGGGGDQDSQQGQGVGENVHDELSLDEIDAMRRGSGNAADNGVALHLDENANDTDGDRDNDGAAEQKPKLLRRDGIRSNGQEKQQRAKGQKEEQVAKLNEELAEVADQFESAEF